jgi:hypothetical protein
MGGKKVLFLFLGLGMPILVFLFLKIFGRNEFEVPLPVLQPPSACQIDNPESYVVSDSVIAALTNEPFDLLIINFGGDSKKLDRIAESFSLEVVKTDSSSLPRPDVEAIKTCSLFLQAPNTLVLIDKLKRIRGYYDGTDRDELDRLEAEIQIILKRY